MPTAAKRIMAARMRNIFSFIYLPLMLLLLIELRFFHENPAGYVQAQHGGLSADFDGQVMIKRGIIQNLNFCTWDKSKPLKITKQVRFRRFHGLHNSGLFWAQCRK